MGLILIGLIIYLDLLFFFVILFPPYFLLSSSFLCPSRSVASTATAPHPFPHAPPPPADVLSSHQKATADVARSPPEGNSLAHPTTSRTHNSSFFPALDDVRCMCQQKGFFFSEQQGIIEGRRDREEERWERENGRKDGKKEEKTEGKEKGERG